MRLHDLRLPSALLAASLLAAPASATWSVVIVNHATREVAVASATCLANFDLKQVLPVIVVGTGAGAAQSTIDLTSGNRQIMFNGLKAGDTPAEILDELLFGAGTQPGRRQYGIAGFGGPAATWTGLQSGLARFGVTGEVDQISYAIQGNILVGDEVVLAAEAALQSSKGDSAQRVMSAMLAARALGGDGRCSCSAGAPQSCGVPPPSFLKSAHCSFLIVARLGDTDGNCNTNGCATGDYYLDLNVIGAAGDPDPVDVLALDHAAWRAGLKGRPDHIKTRVSASATTLSANGESLLDVTVELRDLESRPLATGGATLTVTPADPAAPPVSIGPVSDHGNGSYSFQVRAGTQTGTTELVIVADDGVARAQLYPNLSIELVAPRPLVAGRRLLSLAEDPSVPFTISEPDRPGAGFVLLASVGETGSGALRPLEAGAWLARLQGGGADLVAALGRLDGAGRAEALWTSAGLAAPAGTRLTWVALSYDGTWRASNPVALEIGP